MTKAIILHGVSAVALLTSACTTQIATLPDTIRTAPNGAIAGIPYNLPMLQYRIEATRTLSVCPTRLVIADGAGADHAFVDPTLAFDIKVAAKPRYVRGETYVVDYRSLSSVLKQTSFGITTYPETQNLKTINMSADDKSADVLNSVAALGLTVAGLAGGVPLGALLAAAPAGGGGGDDVGGGAKGLRPLVKADPDRAGDDAELYRIAKAAGSLKTFLDCAPNAQKHIANRADAAKELTDATAAATQAGDRLRNLAALASLGDMPATAREDQATELATAMAAHDEAAAELKQAIDAKANVEGALSRNSIRTWPEHIGDLPELLDTPVDVAVTLAPLLKPTPARGYVLDVRAFSRELAALRDTDPKRFERLAERDEVLRAYADRGLAPARVWEEAEKKQPAACTPGDPALNVVACLESSLKLAVRLDTVELNGGKFLDGKGCGQSSFPTLDCRVDRGIPPSPPDGMRVKLRKGDLDIVDARETRGDKPLAKGGIFVRQPVPGRLFVCRGETCDPNTDANLLPVDPDLPPLLAPQLGQLRYLPFRNTTFQSNELALELAVDGTIAKFEYKDKAATAAVLTATAADIAKQIDDARIKRRADAATAQTQAVAGLQAQIDMIEKQTKLTKLQTPETADQKAAARIIADLEADKALLTAQYDKQKVYNDLVAAKGQPLVAD